MLTRPIRRHLIVAQVVALLVAPLTVAGPATAAPPDAGAPATDAAALAGTLPWEHPGWKLRWAPRADRAGLTAFEHVEDDRAGSDPANFPHIYTEGDHYKFTMNTSPDRQRNEVRGSVAGGHALNLLYGETWRFTYSMFIPDTLKSTTRFTHIMQMKEPGTGTGPIVTMSLRRYGTVQKIELVDALTNTVVGNTDLEPLQNHWVDFDFEMKIGDAPDGWIRWAVHDGANTVIDTTMTGLDTWLGDRVRPKWGIYRSLGDTSGSLQDTYLLLKNLRAYQWSSSLLPPLQVRYEAERARISQGTVESTNGGYTGTGYVNLVGAGGGSVEWTVFALYSGPAALNLWYANAADARPMDVTVNGVTVAAGLSFDRTPAWNDWETRTLITNLRFGINTIRVTATTAAGGPNLDSLDIQQPAPVI
jgi:Polysaccharide lyase/Carbohydrate binding module (family 35)